MQNFSEMDLINNNEFYVWEYIQFYMFPITGFIIGATFVGVHHFVDDHIYEGTPFQRIISAISFITAHSFCNDLHSKCGRCGDVLHVAIGGGIGAFSSIMINTAYRILTFANSFMSWDYIKWDYVKNNNMLPIEAFVIGSMATKSVAIRHLMEEKDLNMPFVAQILEIQLELIKDNWLFEVSYKTFGNTAICLALYIIGGLDSALLSTMIGWGFDLQIGSVDNFIFQTSDYLENNYIIPCATAVVTGIGGYYVSWNENDNSLPARALILLIDPITNTDLFKDMYHKAGHVVPAAVSAISGLMIAMPPVATTIAECYEKTKLIGSSIYAKMTDVAGDLGLFVPDDDSMFVFD